MSRRLSYNKKRYCLSPQSSFHRRHPLYIPHMTAYRFLYTSICKLPYRPDLFSDFHMVLHLNRIHIAFKNPAEFHQIIISTYLLLFSRSQSNPYLYRSLPPFRRSRRIRYILQCVCHLRCILSKVGFYEYRIGDNSIIIIVIIQPQSFLTVFLHFV